MRAKTFAIRNAKELYRDPISYIFSLGLPILMLFVMTLINSNIPKEAEMHIFEIDHLASGIAVFGYSFIMLFAAILVSKDRSSAFLTRLFASPMTSFDYIMGYTIPLLVLALIQAVITFAIAYIIGICIGTTLSIVNILLSIVTLIPTAFLFIGFGIFFGSLFNDKTAPPLCSVMITVTALVGGIWMDVEMLGSGIRAFCKFLPFYNAVNASRCAILSDYSHILRSFINVTAFAAAIYVLSVVTFQCKMQSETK